MSDLKSEWPSLHAAAIYGEASRSARPAISWRSGSLTGAELREAVLRCAAALARHGIGPGSRVGIRLPKCAESVIAILGTLARGAAYVPLDRWSPPARIGGMLERAELSLLITSREVGRQLRSHSPLVAATPVIESTADGSGPEFEWFRHEVPALGLPEVSPSDLAVLFPTSGSSGTPKLVALSHRNVSSFVDWAIDRFELGAGDRFVSHAPFHFDLSTLDLYATLRAGGSVYLIDDKTIKFPAAVAGVLEAQGATVCYAVPTALQLLSQHGGIERRRLSALRQVLFAGEAFPVAGLRKLMQQIPHARYANLYGPTETNVCTYYLVPGVPAEGETAIPLGIPCEHLEVSLRREDGAPCGAGETGEIVVAGPGVMQGYWGRPDLTSAARLDGRLDSYRTGDFARWESGKLRFLGRRDQQVKIHGYRVELPEIEAHLERHPLVGKAAVLLEQAGTLEARLVGFVAVNRGEPAIEESLTRHCAGELPWYARPSRFVIRSELPTTSTGKIDRQSLKEEERA